MCLFSSLWNANFLGGSQVRQTRTLCAPVSTCVRRLSERAKIRGGSHSVHVSLSAWCSLLCCCNPPGSTLSRQVQHTCFSSCLLLTCAAKSSAVRAAKAH